MVHNNKILTVSYGTFSCTLEGFDDSFDTMKAIAEYFRDLAADDRYFGAEPPQPDADMLARIAQREITRQVEAHSTDTGGIVLRAAEPAPAPVVEPEPVIETVPETVQEAPAEPAPEPTMEPEVVADVVAEVQIEEIEITETVVVKAVVAEPAEEPSVVVSQTAEAPEPVEPEMVEPEVVEDVAETVEEDATAEVVDDIAEDETPAVEQEVAEHVAEPAPEPVESPVESIEEEVVPAAVEDVAEIVSEPEVVPAADSIAAKLQRIRAVVSQNDSLTVSDDYSEDQHADGFMSAAAKDISDALEEDEEILEGSDTHDADDEILQVLNQRDARDKDKADGPLENEAVAAEDLSAEPEAEDAIETEDDAAVAPEVVVEEEPAREDQVQAAEETVGDLAEEQAATEDEARIVKVKRVDLEDAIATGKLASVDETEEEDVFAQQPAAQDTSLSPEDEADLMRELAEVEDELTFGTESDDEDDNIFGEDIVSEVADDQEEDGTDQAGQRHKVSDDEADLSRLMNEADEKLDDPETSSRHETYSQLRGAVAAAEAERSAGGSVGGQAQDDAYRDDLAEVIRPRRPRRDGSRASRPVVEDRPAPLKLVAEQRVDDAEDQPRPAPVRPRRVMTVPAPELGTLDAGADSPFAKFAERVGAVELPDLLEAAAAYLSFVESRDQFSRPQLMNKVRLVRRENFNREDGLRAFGQLLRDGKIIKKGGGRFSAAADIGFRPGDDDNEREAG